MENGGRRVGFKFASALQKEAARELVGQRVTEHLEPLLTAQIDNAVGVRHWMVHDPKTGQLERVTGSLDKIDRALASGAFSIDTKDPNIQAFTDLMNRAMDKPSEHVEGAGADLGPITIQWRGPDEDESDAEVKENASPDAETENG